MSLDIAATTRQASPALVGIRAGRGRHGTGTIVADGRVVTTAHNVGHADAVTVHFSDGETAQATVAAADHDLDLAVLAVDTGERTPLAWGDPSAVAVGDDVLALAAPHGTVRATAGAVAAVGSRLRTRTGSPVDGLLEHTAPLPRGASGGPVLDAAGAVVAIDVNRLEGGLYQAVTATEELRTAVAALAEGRVAERPRLGVALQPGRRAVHLRAAVGLPPRDGALIAGVEDGSAAADAGLGTGDLVVGAGDAPVRSADDLLLALRRASGELPLDVVRGVDERRVVVPLG